MRVDEKALAGYSITPRTSYQTAPSSINTRPRSIFYPARSALDDLATERESPGWSGASWDNSGHGSTPSM